jgi:hypothetical protein
MAGSAAASLILESTLTAILLAWVLLHYSAFNKIVGAVGGTSVTAVQSLWARGATGK